MNICRSGGGGGPNYTPVEFHVSVFICFITGTWYLTIPIITIISISISILVLVLSFIDIVYFLCWLPMLAKETSYNSTLWAIERAILCICTGGIMSVAVSVPSSVRPVFRPVPNIFLPLHMNTERISIKIAGCNRYH